MVSVDGTKLDANASKHKSITYARASQLVDTLKSDIAELLEKAECADNASDQDHDPQALPQEIARREALQATLDAACKRRPKRAPSASAVSIRKSAKRARHAKAGPRASTPKPRMMSPKQKRRRISPTPTAA